MKSVLILTTIFIAFWSIITTFKGIILILNKQFEGSKTKWILILMIPVIGPYLWITKGKKMLI